jgi:hypothetical protein
VRSPPPAPPRQILSAKDEARAARRAEHERVMQLASREEYEKAGFVTDAAAAAELRAKEEWEVREARRRADAAERAERMAEENRRLKEQLQEMKLAQREAARAAAAEAKKPAQVDEASLAEKIREMLSADMKKQNERMLEQHTEELQLSLLSKLKFVATQAQEQEAAELAEKEGLKEAAAAGRSKGAKGNKNKKKKKKGKKGGKKRLGGGGGGGGGGDARGSGHGNSDEYYAAASSSPSSRGSNTRGLQRGRSRRRRVRKDADSRSPSSRSSSPGVSGDYYDRGDDGGDDRGDAASTNSDATAASASAFGKFSGVSRPHLLSPLEGPAGFGQQAQAKRDKQKRDARSKLTQQREMERQTVSEGVLCGLGGVRRPFDEEEQQQQQQQQQQPPPVPPPVPILGPEDTLESMDENTARLLRKSWELIGGAGGRPEMNSRNAAPGSAYLDTLDEMAGVGGAAGRPEEGGGGARASSEAESTTLMAPATATGSAKKKRLRKKKKKKKKATAGPSSDAVATIEGGEKSVENPEEEKDDEQPPLLTPTSAMSAAARDTATLPLPGTPQSASASAVAMVPASSAAARAAGAKGFKDPTIMLGKREWENEVARNILVLYKANMSSIRQAEADRKAAANLKNTMEKMDTDGDDDAAAAGGGSGNRDGDYSDGQESGSESPTRRRRGSKGEGSKLPPVKGARRGSKKGSKNDEMQPSRMIKIQNSSHGGKAVKQHSPHQIWYAGSGNVRAVWDGLVVADEEEAEKAMRKLTR